MGRCDRKGYKVLISDRRISSVCEAVSLAVDVVVVLKKFLKEGALIR